jgi:hypothetical protein
VEKVGFNIASCVVGCVVIMHKKPNVKTGLFVN